MRFIRPLQRMSAALSTVEEKPMLLVLQPRSESWSSNSSEPTRLGEPLAPGRLQCGRAVGIVFWKEIISKSTTKIHRTESARTNLKSASIINHPYSFLILLKIVCTWKAASNKIISWLRLIFQTWEIMEGANTIIMCSTFGAWIWKIWRTSLKGFWTRRQKIRHCDLLHHFMTSSCSIKWTGKRHS